MADLVKSCFWELQINNSPISDDRRNCVESISIEENDAGSDTMTIDIEDPEFLFIEDDIFVPDAPISASIGWYDDTYRVTFDGYISAIDINFPESGYPKMTINCIDKTHLMNRKKKKRSWDNVTRADVVQKIAQEYGFKCVISPDYKGEKEETISQSDETDIAFCESLAGEEKGGIYKCKLKGNTLYYVEKGVLENPVADLAYKEYPYDIISFNPQINRETKEEEVEEADINTNNKKTDSAKVNNNNNGAKTQGSQVSTSSKSMTFNTPTPSGGKNMTFDAATGKWNPS